MCHEQIIFRLLFEESQSPLKRAVARHEAALTEGNEDNKELQLEENINFVSFRLLAKAFGVIFYLDSSVRPFFVSGLPLSVISGNPWFPKIPAPFRVTHRQILRSTSVTARNEPQ